MFPEVQPGRWRADRTTAFVGAGAAVLVTTLGTATTAPASTTSDGAVANRAAATASTGPTDARPPQAAPLGPTADVPTPVVVRLTRETRGRGAARRSVARLVTLSTTGRPRTVRVLRHVGLRPVPSLSPDGRRVAVARDDGRVAIVALRGGALRLLTPPGLPRSPKPGTGDGTDWTVFSGAPVSWSPDGRVVVAHGLVGRRPTHWLSSLEGTRSVACVVRSGRCSTAGRGAPADLVPLSGGRTLRLDGPLVGQDEDGRTSWSLDTVRDQRRILNRRDDPVRTAASVGDGPTGAGGATRLSTTIRTGRRGVLGLGAPAAGPAGVLVRRRTVTFLPRRNPFGETSDGPGVDVRVRTLTPWLVSTGGRLRTLPLRLVVDPIGSLPDGRWLLPSAQARASEDRRSLEPGLATLDARGRVAPVLVGGRRVTPVRIALDAGLPDTFAAGSALAAAWPAGDDLLVVLENTGYDGRLFFPPDAALVRLPLGGGPPVVVDGTPGGTYDAR